ncbi:hypothetical protein [Thiomicrospira sp.]|uniref:hypothetical protein n=1 Tax=Thiomicrospira sp. TaxID=935 RepID=UPI002F94A433
MSFIMVSYRSLPVPIKKLIKEADFEALNTELEKARYSAAVRLAAKHHYEQQNTGKTNDE